MGGFLGIFGWRIGRSRPSWLFTGNKTEAEVELILQEVKKKFPEARPRGTRAAQFEGLSAEASYRLQKVGGMVLGMVK